MKKLIEYQKFPDLKSANDLIWLLNANEIFYEIDDKGQRYSLVSDFDNNFVIIKIQEIDIEKVNQLLNENENENINNHYLYTFSDKDIIGVIANPNEYSEEEIKIANEIIKKRNIQITNDLIINNKSNPIEKNENKWKNSYSKGFLLFLFFLIFSFFQTPKVNENDLTKKENLVLEMKPEYKSVEGKNRRYWIVLEFQGFTDNFEIGGIDYKYINHPAFKNDIGVLDTINIGYIDNEIYLLSKKGYQYCDLEKANNHKSRNQLFVRIVSLISLIVLLIPILMKNKPKTNFWLILAIVLGLTIILIFSLDVVSMQDLTIPDFK